MEARLSRERREWVCDSSRPKDEGPSCAHVREAPRGCARGIQGAELPAPQCGVEPIFRILRDHNLPIAPSTYYAIKKRPPSARAVSDERLVPIVKAVHEDNCGGYGARKLWHALKRKGEDLGRDQVARLMRAAGLRGVTRRKRVRQAPALIEVRSPDLIQRGWFRDAPDLVWVADFTHIWVLRP